MTSADLMAHPFDATLKDILGQSPADFAPVLGLPTHLPVRTLNVDLSTVSAATDVAFGFGDPFQEIVDINLQSGADARAAAGSTFTTPRITTITMLRCVRS